MLLWASCQGLCPGFHSTEKFGALFHCAWNGAWHTLVQQLKIIGNGGETSVNSSNEMAHYITSGNVFGMLEMRPSDFCWCL